MNDYQIGLYEALCKLVQENEAFYFSDQQLDDSTYRIFNYRLASYTDFLHPGALECRGIMFEIDRFAKPIRLASLPIHKFFNLHENPFVMDLDVSTLSRVMIKSDGSLISTYLDDGLLKLKSKGSLSSDQAIDSMNWLELNPTFKSDLLYYATNDYTVNMEWCSPNNRIVLGYKEPRLIVLNIRNNKDGTYVSPDDYQINHHIKYIEPNVQFDDAEMFIASVPDMKEDIEGFVCVLEDETWFKLKTLKYLSLHKTKDSINCSRLLFEAVLEEATDDMRSLFHDDELAIELIDNMEHFVDQRYNHMVDTVEKFYESNKLLSRKDYAILGNKELDKMFFGLAMSKYLNKEIDYKIHMKKNWKKYGLQETTDIIEQ
jgi:T4 RnlA family RNA ligase